MLLFHLSAQRADLTERAQERGEERREGGERKDRESGCPITHSSLKSPLLLLLFLLPTPPFHDRPPSLR